jgi:hypothetical protein
MLQTMRKPPISSEMGASIQKMGERKNPPTKKPNIKIPTASNFAGFF